MTALDNTKTAHKWDEGTVTTQPTCTAEGERTHHCTQEGCDGTKTEKIAMVDHTPNTSKWLSDGSHHWRECSVCHNALDNTKIAHTWDDGTVTKPATCTEKGEMALTCTVCRETKTEDIPMVPHDFADQPWEKDNDAHWHVCRNCTTTDAKQAHTWDAGTVTTPATDDAEGVMTYTCTACDQTRTETIGKTGHTYSEEWDGDDTNHWHACTIEHTEGEKCPETSGKAPHTWDAGTVTKEPTDQTTGVKTFTCTVCGQTRTETLPKHEHVWADTWDHDAAAHWHNCTWSNCPVTVNSQKDGYAPHVYTDGADTTCNVCGYVRTVTPPAVGYTITFNPNGGTLSSASTTMTTGADGRLSSLPTATRSGYTFQGWFTLASGGNQVTTATVFGGNSTVYAHWSRNSSGGSSSGGGGGGSSSGSSSVTVPVSGDRNSVNVSASVSGTTATVSKIDTDKLNNVAGSDVRTGMVEVDFTGLNRTINTVNLPTDAVKEIAKAANDRNNDAEGLTVKLSSAEASFDAAALDGIQKQTTGSQLTLSIAKASASSLNARQKETVGSSPVFDLTMRSGSRTITDFGGGYATISIPYTLSAGQDPSKVVVYYLDSNGNITPCETMYDVRSKSVIFTTSHFSKYVISYEETGTNDWANPFRDVASSAYYLNAVRWALENSVTSGTSANTFSPNAVCTRAQIVTFLYRSMA